jgi:hypothetical protein
MRDFLISGQAYAPEDGAGGAGVVDAGETGTGEPSQTAIAQTGETQPAISAADIEERAYKATLRAMEEARASEEARLREAQAREAEYQRRAAMRPDPTADALDALDLRQEMYEEALEMHPDMPAEARNQLKADLRSFRSIEMLRGAKESGLHRKLADAAAGEWIRTGRYMPKSALAQTPMREPAHSEPSARIAVPEAYVRQVAALGLQLTEAELEEAYREDALRGGIG